MGVDFFSFSYFLFSLLFFLVLSLLVWFEGEVSVVAGSNSLFREDIWCFSSSKGMGSIEHSRQFTAFHCSMHKHSGEYQWH